MLLCSSPCVMFRRSQNFNWIHSWCHGPLCGCECDSWSRILTASSTKSLSSFSKSVYHENFMIKLQHSGHTAAHRVQWHIHETFCSLRFLIITVSCAFICLSHILYVSSCTFDECGCWMACMRIIIKVYESARCFFILLCCRK